jgi:hypothetical protein
VTTVRELVVMMLLLLARNGEDEGAVRGHIIAQFCSSEHILATVHDRHCVLLL